MKQKLPKWVERDISQLKREAAEKSSQLKMLRADYDRQVAENSKLRSAIRGVRRILESI
jgi:hypothetical protein